MPRDSAPPGQLRVSVAGYSHSHTIQSTALIVCVCSLHIGVLAAGLQGASVAAGIVFATMQSAAMGGYGVAVVAGVAQGAGGLIAVAGAVGAKIASKL